MAPRDLELKIPPGVVFLATGAVMWLAARALPGFGFDFPSRRGLVWALLAAGLVLGAAGVATFVRLRTSLDPRTPHTASAFVTSGVYGLSRNPMYLGLVLVLLSWSFALANVLAFPFTAAFVLYLTRFQIEPEERALRAAFGEAYAGYAARVRRWV